jgi:hypothetical protein
MRHLVQILAFRHPLTELLCELRDVARVDFLLDKDNRFLQDGHLVALREILPVSGWPAVLDCDDEICHRFVLGVETLFDYNKDALW